MSIWGIYIFSNLPCCIHSVGFVLSFYKKWIKNLGSENRYSGRYVIRDSLDKTFSSWKDTKKPYIYFTLWSIGVHMHFVVSLIILLITHNEKLVFVFAFVGYLPFFWIVFLTIHHIFLRKEKRKNNSISV